ncbi:MAG: ergothioneine biosynthesis protein EgtB [Planctomycetes bacterium]|nr:ergothioneine biosynthesis protein EgtB [Planctomycetota bacterium]
MLIAYRRIRTKSRELMAPLSAEDFRVQSMPDVSPPYWNLGHTSWFFARNVLHAFGRYDTDWRGFEFPFNSYYEGLGPRLARPLRGKVARPTTAETLAFRDAVDVAMERLLGDPGGVDRDRLAFLTTTGLQHEQQHQELFLTEILHIRWSDPPELRRPYRSESLPPCATAPVPLCFLEQTGGLVEIGNREGGWCWDNELAVHRAFVAPFRLANRLVTNAEWRAFVDDGGYRQPLLWLSNGWAKVQELGWTMPFYWERDGGAFRQWTLRGWSPLAADAPVCHVSFYEADAFARWFAAQHRDHAAVRLPTEREWECAMRAAGFAAVGGNFLDDDRLVTLAPRGDGSTLLQLGGDGWQWTASHYEPYPGYRAFDGDLMEYNGKFMDNQRVLRGGSLATPKDHIRVSYRNFWPADTRFQFTCVRLAADSPSA